MGEEPELPPREKNASEEIPEDTPHFLNPEVLRDDKELDVIGEEGEPTEATMPDDSETPSEPQGEEAPSEKMEEVLNSGMAFIGGLLEVATGKKMTATGDDGKMVKIDKETGEVTLKFKLPGF